MANGPQNGVPSFWDPNEWSSHWVTVPYCTCLHPKEVGHLLVEKPTIGVQKNCPIPTWDQLMGPEDLALQMRQSWNAQRPAEEEFCEEWNHLLVQTRFSFGFAQNTAAGLAPSEKVSNRWKIRPLKNDIPFQNPSRSADPNIFESYQNRSGTLTIPPTQILPRPKPSLSWRGEGGWWSQVCPINGSQIWTIFMDLDIYGTPNAINNYHLGMIFNTNRW